VLAVAAHAQSYPAKPVRVIVTTVPGPLDTFARIISEKAATSLKQPLVIENKPGAGGNIGADMVAKSAPDGYTLLFALDTTFAVTTGVLPHVKSGRLRALGVSSTKRSALAPEVPTVAEAGFQGFDASFAYALLAPAGTPEDIVQLLNREVRKALAAPDVQEKNRVADYSALDLDARRSAAWLKEKREHWASVVQRAGIIVE